MVLERRAVGIDLGTQTVKVVELRVSTQGATVTHALRLERSALVEGDATLQVLARGLRQQLSQARISSKGVMLGIGGPDTMIRYTRVPPVPSWRLKVLMDYEVGEISEKVGEPLASDFQVLQLVREADEDQTLLIGLAKEKPLSNLLEALEAEGITVEHALLGPVAIYAAQDAFGWKPETQAEEDDLLLVADMGAENLCLALVLNSRLVFARSVSFGGKNFTEALAQQLGIDMLEAERVKISRGGIQEESGVLREGIRPLSVVAGQLLGLLQSSLRFSAAQTGVKLPPLNRVVLCGAGMQLRGLDGFISKGLEKPTEFFQPSGLKLAATLPAPTSRELAERPGDYALALGLGTAGLRAVSQPGGVKSTVSILPRKYLARREFWDRTVFLYAAGIVLLVVLILRIGYGIVRSSSARQTLRELTAASGQLEERKREYDEMQKEADVRKARLNRLLREAEQTAFQGHVLDLLSRSLRPEMRLERVYMDDATLTEDGTSSDYGLYVECRVSNEKRQGVQWIGELQTALKADERVGSVETVSSESDRQWRIFKLLLRPNYVNY